MSRGERTSRIRNDARPRGPGGRFAINPDFALMRTRYQIRFANGAECLQLRMGELVSNMYGARGLQIRQASAAAVRPGQTTLVACQGDHVFGTLTLGVDAGDGLLADTLYGDEIDAYRAQGCKVCEATRLAMDPALGTPDVMATIFNLAFMLARNAQRMTDAFIEVHPRHANFYRRMLGYQVVGPERTCPRVGAPAVLMHLSLATAETRLTNLTSNPDENDRSWYRYFLPQAEQASLIEKLILPTTDALPA